MEDFHAEARKLGSLAWFRSSFLPRTYRCTSVRDYIDHRHELQPTTSVWYSSARQRFAGKALVTFSNVTRFNCDPTDDNLRCDLADFSGSTDLLVAPLLDTSFRLHGLSPLQCDRVLASRQLSFKPAFCIWAPDLPCLVLAGFTLYDPERDRLRSDDFTLPDHIAFS